MKELLITIFTPIFLLPSPFTYGQTPAMKKQARNIIAGLKSTYDYPADARDTLIDLNGDSFKDLLIEYYGSAGTGLKNRVSVYLYHASIKKFRPCEQLNYLANPTFYFSKKIVAGYYVANGGGSATKLKWNGLRLDTLEHINVDITYHDSTVTFKLFTNNFITKKKTYKTLHVMNLPKEYRYFDYIPIIKNERL
jgi:hypothetical protein